MTNPALIELVNAALIRIGQEPIVSLDNVSTVSSTVTAVRATVGIVKRKLLRCNDWNCARIKAKLARLAENIGTGWKYAYVLPKEPECLRVVQVSIDDGETYIHLDEYYNRHKGPIESLFDIDDDVLLSNAESVWIKYTADIDAAKFDSALASTFVAQLAAELAYTLPASVSLAEYLQKLARKELREARSLNARERNVVRPEGEVIGIRYGYSDNHLRVDMSDEME